MEAACLAEDLGKVGSLACWQYLQVFVGSHSFSCQVCKKSKFVTRIKSQQHDDVYTLLCPARFHCHPFAAML